MDLNSVEMFVRVVQAGSLSAAAMRLNIPLPTLSRHIRMLERQLKVQLLERTARGIKLTGSGARLYERVSHEINALAEAREAISDDQVELKGQLRLSIPPSFEPWWELLDAFQLQYPDIRVSVYTTGRRVDLVQDGIDVSLRVSSSGNQSEYTQDVILYRHVLVASPNLLAKYGEPKTIEDLRRFPCATWSTHIGSTSAWRLGNQIFEPEAILATNDYLHLRARALLGAVVTELPPFLANHLISQGRLSALLPDYPLPEMRVFLVYPSHRYPSSIVRAYLDFCKQQVARFL